MSFSRPRPGGHAAYAGRIIAEHHGSILEHAVLNLIIAGVSRTFTHELVRHRAGFSYSQLSQRYVDHSEWRYVVPPILRDEVAGCIAKGVEGNLDAGECAGLALVSAASACWNAYDRISEYLGGKLDARGRGDTGQVKRVREAARAVLPGCTETKIFVTANLRALRHFVEMRLYPGADMEMIGVAAKVLDVLRREFPDWVRDYAVGDTSRGPALVDGYHRKV